MVNWYGAGRDADRLIAKGRYAKAGKLLREMIADSPADVHLKKKLADVLALDGKKAEASSILENMVEHYAGDGFLTKAIAVVKRIQRIDPGRQDLSQRLAGLAHEREKVHGTSPRVSEESAGQGSSPGEAETAGRRVDDLEAVLRSPLFVDFSITDVLALIQGLNLVTFQAGEIVMAEGEPGASLLVLASGQVRVYVRNDVGHQVQLRVLQAGEFFGEISILTGQARTATVTAAEPCEVLELGRTTIQELGKKHPQFRQVIREVCESRARSPEELLARSDLEIPL